MKLLVLCPGKQPKNKSDIECFSDVLNYYLPPAIKKYVETNIVQIPLTDNNELKKLFSSISVSEYDAIITLGLRYYNKISAETTNLLRSRFAGFFCQVYDGSRLDYDPVDITFTFKNDDERMSDNNHWYVRHKLFNEYMGWAADETLNYPNQDPDDLRILIDHTNYGENPTDNTVDIIQQIDSFIKSEIWKDRYKSVSVRRFDSGKVVDVDFTDLNIQRYDRTAIPFTEITKEHGKAHIFMVTHPESVGLVVLETSLAGALTVTPENFIPKDRLATVRHYTYETNVDWHEVLNKINPAQSREVALENSWNNVAKRIIRAIRTRQLRKRT